MGEAGKVWPSALQPGTSEGRLSLDAERAQPPFSRRAGKHALAATALAPAVAPIPAACSSSPSTLPTVGSDGIISWAMRRL